MQTSWPWATDPPGGGPGDGAAGLNEEDARKFLATYFGVVDPAQEGVCRGVLGELALTGDSSPLTIAAGAGICLGMYYTDAPVELTVTTPSTGTTGGRVVLRTNFAGTSDGDVGEAQTRLAVKLNTDGNAAIPALTQNFGTTWEVPLWNFTITTGGAITATDERVWRRWPGGLAADAVDTAAIQDEAVTGSHIADSTINAVNINTGIPILTTRIGGHASNWWESGSSVYQTGQVHMVAGVSEIVIPFGSTGSGIAVSLTGTALAGKEDSVMCMCWIESLTWINPPPAPQANVFHQRGGTQINLQATRTASPNPGSTTTIRVGWLAIGEA